MQTHSIFVHTNTQIYAQIHIAIQTVSFTIRQLKRLTYKAKKLTSVKKKEGEINMLVFD